MTSAENAAALHVPDARNVYRRVAPPPPPPPPVPRRSDRRAPSFAAPPPPGIFLAPVGPAATRGVRRSRLARHKHVNEDVPAAVTVALRGADSRRALSPKKSARKSRFTTFSVYETNTSVDDTASSFALVSSAERRASRSAGAAPSETSPSPDVSTASSTPSNTFDVSFRTVTMASPRTMR